MLQMVDNNNNVIIVDLELSFLLTAKFNGIVPGTFTDLDTTTTDTLPTATDVHVTTLVTTLLPTLIFGVSDFESNTNISIIVPLIGGVTILTISIMISCVVIWFWNRRKRQFHTASSVTTQPQNQGIDTTTNYKFYNLHE